LYEEEKRRTNALLFRFFIKLLNLSDASSPFISRVRDLHQAMSRRVEDVRKKTGPEELMTKGDHNATNRRTLDDLRRMCNIPTPRPAASRAEVHFR
jgi:hypothetical protein